MQISRLFEIVYILLDKKQVTAKELAQRFEVSVRTIFRDIDTLCEAGIPIYTNKGKGGGIRLLDNFILNKTALSTEEQQEVITALQSLRATQSTDGQALSKLSALFGGEMKEWLTIDFGGWNEEAKNKFELIKKAILNKQVISFSYYNAKMEKTRRKVSPLQLAFKDRTWYLRAYCQMRKQVRLFKLTRIRQLELTDQTFNWHLAMEEESKENQFQIVRKVVRLKLLIDGEMAYRVYDEFEEEQIQCTDKGEFIVTAEYPEDNWLYGYLLSYGSYLKVIEPVRISEVLRKQIKKTIKRYEEQSI